MLRVFIGASVIIGSLITQAAHATPEIVGTWAITSMRYRGSVEIRTMVPLDSVFNDKVDTTVAFPDDSSRFVFRANSTYRSSIDKSVFEVAICSTWSWSLPPHLKDHADFSNIRRTFVTDSGPWTAASGYYTFESHPSATTTRIDTAQISGDTLVIRFRTKRMTAVTSDFFFYDLAVTYTAVKLPSAGVNRSLYSGMAALSMARIPELQRLLSDLRGRKQVRGLPRPGVTISWERAGSAICLVGGNNGKSHLPIIVDKNR